VLTHLKSISTSNLREFKTSTLTALTDLNQGRANITRRRPIQLIKQLSYLLLCQRFSSRQERAFDDLHQIMIIHK
jgi:hypothetical protein